MSSFATAASQRGWHRFQLWTEFIHSSTPCCVVLRIEPVARSVHVRLTTVGRSEKSAATPAHRRLETRQLTSLVKAAQRQQRSSSVVHSGHPTAARFLNAAGRARSV